MRSVVWGWGIGGFAREGSRARKGGVRGCRMVWNYMLHHRGSGLKQTAIFASEGKGTEEIGALRHACQQLPPIHLMFFFQTHVVFM